jgi:hypothetical protein
VKGKIRQGHLAGEMKDEEKRNGEKGKERKEM